MIAGLALAAAVAAAPLTAGTGLDCALGIDGLTAQMNAAPKLHSYPASNPLLETWDDRAALVLYAVTRPGHPAHPAVVRRKINGMGPGMSVITAACGYGDKAGFDQLLNEIEILNAGVRKNYGG